MAFAEKTYLLHTFRKEHKHNAGLSLYFAIICIIDVFGVFPIITLPKTIINCGKYGLIIVTLVCFIQLYTATLLGKSWLLACKIQPDIKDKNRYPYSALTELAYGQQVSKCVTVLLNITIFGAGVPNIIVASQNIDLSLFRLSDINVSYCWWMVIVSVLLCPILWLGSPKEMKILCSISVCVVVLVFGFVLSSLLQTTVLESDLRISNTNLDINIWKNIAIAYGVLSFQFDIHPTLLAIQVDMYRKSNIDFAVISGYGVSLAMFLVIYMMSFAKFGNSVKDSVLESLETSTLQHISALLVAIQLGLSSAVSNSALYQSLEDNMEIPKDFNKKRCVLRTFLTLLALLLAESVPKFELVMSLIGATLTGPLMFIFPPLIYVKLLLMKNNEYDVITMDIVLHPAKVSNSVNYKDRFKLETSKKLEICFCIFIVVAGCIGTVATTYANISDALKCTSFSQPCIYNIFSFI